MSRIINIGPCECCGEACTCNHCCMVLRIQTAAGDCFGSVDDYVPLNLDIAAEGTLYDDIEIHSISCVNGEWLVKLSIADCIDADTCEEGDNFPFIRIVPDGECCPTTGSVAVGCMTGDEVEEECNCFEITTATVTQFKDLDKPLRLELIDRYGDNMFYGCRPCLYDNPGSVELPDFNAPCEIGSTLNFWTCDCCTPGPGGVPCFEMTCECQDIGGGVGNWFCFGVLGAGAYATWEECRDAPCIDDFNPACSDGIFEMADVKESAEQDCNCTKKKPLCKSEIEKSVNERRQRIR